jgi:hypothetical protein
MTLLDGVPEICGATFGAGAGVFSAPAALGGLDEEVEPPPPPQAAMHVVTTASSPALVRFITHPPFTPTLDLSRSWHR